MVVVGDGFGLVEREEIYGGRQIRVSDANFFFGWDDD